jgi:uncharacterized protein GlcG (DUF336 family)
MQRLLVALACVSLSFGAELASRKSLTLAAVKEMAAAAEAEARKNKWNVAIAIVDEGGHLLYFQRMDEVQLASVQIAQGKARTALLYKRPTKLLDESISGGRTVMLNAPEVMPLEGGLPVTVEGRIIGGIGVSGVLSPQDAQIAQAALAVLEKR